MGFSWCLRTIEKNGCLCTSLSMLIKKLYGFSFVFGFLNKYKAEWPKRTLAAFLSVLMRGGAGGGRGGTGPPMTGLGGAPCTLGPPPQL